MQNHKPITNKEKNGIDGDSDAYWEEFEMRISLPIEKRGILEQESDWFQNWNSKFQSTDQISSFDSTADFNS